MEQNLKKKNYDSYSFIGKIIWITIHLYLDNLDNFTPIPLYASIYIIIYMYLCSRPTDLPTT
jgi:hypothetical protein